MKTIAAIFCLLVLSSATSAQSADPSKWMCRNLADSGGFTYQGETIFGTQACRPVPQAAPMQATATAVPAAAPRTPTRSWDNHASSLGYKSCGDSGELHLSRVS